MNRAFKISHKIPAWSVHLFTACGMPVGFMAMLAISEKNWRAAMTWLLVALAIDGIDGTLARKFKAAEVLPFVNGKMIDYVIDFANYALIPAYFFYAAHLVEASWNLPLAFLILLVSAIYYGIEGMVSEDFYFVGFPVMWNVVIFYLVFVFSLNAYANAAVIIFFAVLHFVPIKFAYPSRAVRLKWLTIFFSLIILAIMPVIVWFYPNVPPWQKWIAAACLIYFGGLAVADTLGLSNRRRLNNS